MNRSFSTTSVLILPLALGVCCAFGQGPPSITGFSADGLVSWTNPSSSTVSFVECSEALNTGPWYTVYAKSPAGLTVTATVDVSRTAACLRVQNADPGAVPPGMVLVPAGAFLMGDAFGEDTPDELPVHAVTLDAFYIDEVEVTNDKVRDALQWAYDEGVLLVDAFGAYNATGTVRQLIDLDDSECRITWDAGSETFGLKAEKGAGYPCVEITWYGACAVANYQSGREGLSPCYDLGDGTNDWSCDWDANGYRLPSEAEWEKAARGGRMGRRFAGEDPDTISHGEANFFSFWSDGAPFYPYDVSLTSGHHPDYDDSVVFLYTSPGGGFPANAYGIFDMFGNVAEYCWDTYGGAYYSVSPGVNPRGPAPGPLKVVRGGSWNNTALNCRVADRGTGTATGSGSLVGFRLARNAGF